MRHPSARLARARGRPRYLLLRILSLIAVVVFLSALAAPARAGMVGDCGQQYDRDLQISGCTAAIRSGQWQGKDLAWAYTNRGVAYADLGEYRRAIDDYDQALRLDPGNAIAYTGRANARCRSGHVEAALDDRMQALRLGAFSAKDLQTYLRNRGFYNGAIDGDVGPISKRALRDWTVAGCPSE